MTLPASGSSVGNDGVVADVLGGVDDFGGSDVALEAADDCGVCPGSRRVTDSTVGVWVATTVCDGLGPGVDAAHATAISPAITAHASFFTQSTIGFVERKGLAVSVAIRVIPCLDVDAGRVVKGVNFANLRDAGDPVELAARYCGDGADEITFLDISASAQGRATTLETVTRTAETVFIPLTVGGGVRGVEDVDVLLRAGADKVSVNTAAIADPAIISAIADRFGNQVLVLSLDAKREPGRTSGFGVTTHGGRRSADRDAVDWARQAVDLGCGEVLLNSMDADGTTAGFDVEMIEAVRRAVDVPLVASGGAGQASDFVAAARAGADAVLAASVFHFGTCTIAEVKRALSEAGFPVRLTI